MLPHFVFFLCFFFWFLFLFSFFCFFFFSLALLGVNFVVNALLFATKTPLAKRSTCNKSNATVKRSNT